MSQERRSIERATGTIPLYRRWCGHRGGQVVRDVLGADRLLGESSSERGAQRHVSVGGEQRVQAIDIANPDARAAMGELGQIVQGRGPQRQEMLPLQIPFRALAGHGGDVLRAMLRQRRLGVRLEEALMDGLEAAGDDAHAIPIEKQRPGMPIASGGIE